MAGKQMTLCKSPKFEIVKLLESEKDKSYPSLSEEPEYELGYKWVPNVELLERMKQTMTPEKFEQFVAIYDCSKMVPK